MLALRKFSQIKKIALRINRVPYNYNLRGFAAAPGGLNLQGLANAMSQTATGDLGSRKINTQTLCDLIGSRYYQHNEEIEMDENKMVKCFDENDAILGEMTLREALMAAQGAKKDLVLRNAKINPPVVKVMNYKKELLKRLFKKLGKEMEDKDLKSKTIRLATTISYHDMENKKR
jgi:hypothetical protein